MAKTNYVVWKEVWSNRGLVRKCLGAVETSDEVRARLEIMRRVFNSPKTLVEGGRNNITLVSAKAEIIPVVHYAEALRKF